MHTFSVFVISSSFTVENGSSDYLPALRTVVRKFPRRQNQLVRSDNSVSGRVGLGHLCLPKTVL